MATSIQFEYAVYMLSSNPANPTRVLQEILAAKYANLKQVDRISSDPQQPLIQSRWETNLTEYSPPDVHYSQHSEHGISPEQAKALQRSGGVLILKFAHPKANVWSALKAANDLVESVARNTHGLVWDEETREIFSPDEWHKKRLESWDAEVPEISRQTVIHIYQNNEYARAVTLGMSKVGLPEVVVAELVWSSTDQAGNLINVFCQSMVEGATFTLPGEFNLDLREIKNDRVREKQQRALKSEGSGIACLLLKEGKREQGDAKNRLIELSSDRYPGLDTHAKQDQMLSAFFGSEDSITHVKHTDELLEASRKAKAKLPDLQKSFNSGLQPGEFILVKAPFMASDGNHEWMWVEVTSWKGNDIRGLLQNDPFNVPGLRSGQVVKVRQEEVFDYIHQYSDKHTEGNTTGAILKQMQGGNTRETKITGKGSTGGCDTPIN